MPGGWTITKGTWKNEAQKRHYEKHRIRLLSEGRMAVKKRTLLNRALIVKAKDVPCADCGGRFHPCAMDFDHINGTKEYNVGRMVGQASEARLLAEIAKCEVVCANCHRVRSFVTRVKTRKRPAHWLPENLDDFVPRPQ
jgi:hypothetical protein